MVHLGGGRYRADTSGTTMAFAAVLRGERLVFASLGDSPVLLVGRDEEGAPRCARLVGQHTPTNADEARRIGAAANGGVCRFVYMGTAGAQDQDIFARDEAARIGDVDRPQAREAQARRATPVLLVPEGPLTLEDDGTASEQADMRYLWHGHTTPASEAARDSAGSDASFHAVQRSGGRVVEEALFSLTRCFGDLYAQHHGVSAEPEVRIVSLVRVWVRVRLAYPYPFS